MSWLGLRGRAALPLHSAFLILLTSPAQPQDVPSKIFDASEKYIAEKIPLVILAGKEYGYGSSRDWAAKGPLLLGVRVVIAENYERVHRSNLVGMGILPLQFVSGETAQSLGLTGEEIIEIAGVRELVEKFTSGRQVKVRATFPRSLER